MKISHLAIGCILFAEALLLVYSPSERHSFHHFFAASNNFNNFSFWALSMLKTSVPHILMHIKYEICYNRNHYFRSLFFSIRKWCYNRSDRTIFVDDFLVWYNLQTKYWINQIIFDTTFIFDNFIKRRKTMLWRLQKINLIIEMSSKLNNSLKKIIKWR